MWGKENQYKIDIYTAEDEEKWVKRMRDFGYKGELFLKFESKIINPFGGK